MSFGVLEHQYNTYTASSPIQDGEIRPESYLAEHLFPVSYADTG